MATNIFPPQSSAQLVMPSTTSVGSSNITLKNAGASSNASLAAFWTAIDLSHTAQGWESVKLAAAADTTEQTIVDVSGLGVLTHVVSPELSGSGVITIRVTTDGEVNTFVSPTIATGARFCIGDFKGWEAGTTATGLGGSDDDGYSNTTARHLMTTPEQALNNAAVGMKFSSSLKVTVQGSVNITGTALLLNGCANYNLTIPEGL